MEFLKRFDENVLIKKRNRNQSLRRRKFLENYRKAKY